VTARADQAVAGRIDGRFRAARRDELGTESAQTRACCAGIVDLEGGGTTPHPLGGGAAGVAPVPPTGASR
jgi:hypothetical protein